MIRRIGYVLLFVSLFTVAGGHWAVLQGVAWGSMILTYAQDAPLSEALEKTFGGDAPCKLCHLVREGRKKETHSSTTSSSSRVIDKFLLRSNSLFTSPSRRDLRFPPLSDELAPRRAIAPAAPVPRAV